MADLTIVLWLWQGPGGAWGRYTVEHVNRAARMVREHLTLEHELVVITDQPEGDFISDLRIVPIWPDLADRGRCWRRLKAFAPEMKEIIGPRWAWIDLDCVVLGDLTPLFQRDEDLVLWRSQSTRNPYNGSILLHTSGTWPQIWTGYSPSIVTKLPGSDQSWLAHLLGPHMPVWTDKDGVFAYNRHARRWRRGPRESARIVFFPGSIKANSNVVCRETPWIGEILKTYGEVQEDAYQWRPRAHQLRAMRRRTRSFGGRRAGVNVRVLV